uniref:Uncharacterized protein n=1 Tax=Phytophthora ramorum TaxID=164328 RepID=H3GY88_PHYRM
MEQHRAAVTHLHAVWFSWYAHDPRWQAAEPKRQRSKAKSLVAFMMLFLTDGFVLGPAGDGYRDQVFELGKWGVGGALVAVLDLETDPSAPEFFAVAIKKERLKTEARWRRQLD